jgi:hypothetical protein
MSSELEPDAELYEQLRSAARNVMTPPRHYVIPEAPHHTGVVRVFGDQVYRLTGVPTRPQGHRAVWCNIVTGEIRNTREDDANEYGS